MVAAVAPGKFYGSSLPRPRFYSDVKLNEERVDPPVSIMDPFLSWANDAHWSMGGLSIKRHRLQGRIEGSVKNLRAQQERVRRKSASPVVDLNPTTEKKTRLSGHVPRDLAALGSDSDDTEEKEEEMKARASRSPDAPADKKRRRIRRLGEEFEKIATEVAVRRLASRTRSRRAASKDAEIGEGYAVSSDEYSKQGKAKNRNERKEVVVEMPRRASPRKKQAT